MADSKPLNFHEKLTGEHFLLSEENLQKYGYPLPHPYGPEGRAIVFSTELGNHSWYSSLPNERICARCGARYLVDVNGYAILEQSCLYHSGSRVDSAMGTKYTCCQKYEPTSKCTYAKGHVWKYVNPDVLFGYVKTMPRDTPPEMQGVYAIDCGMSYTTRGLELTKVVVVDEDCDVIYGTFVKPSNPIIDYNSDLSAVTESNLDVGSMTLENVQVELLDLFSKDSILIGHGLSRYLNALKIIHTNVVDTSEVFLHQQGYPFKRTLKSIYVDHFGYAMPSLIRAYCCKGNAIACIKLMKLKAK